VAAGPTVARLRGWFGATRHFDGFGRLLRAEFTKFRTVRSWMIALCAAAALFVLLSFVSALASRSAGADTVPVGPGGEPVTDTYMFVRQTLIGDGSLTARVTSLSGARTALPARPSSGFGTASRGEPGGGPVQAGLAPWAKAGILLEPSTKQGTVYAAVMVTGAHGVRMQGNYTRDAAGLSGAVGPASPRWLRLSRTGDVVTGYDSANGGRWSKIGTVRLAGLPRTVQVGLFVTSPVYFVAGNQVSSVATASFDQVSARGDLPRPSWTPDEVAGVYPALPSSWQQRSAGAFTISGSGDIAPLVGDVVSAHWSGASVVNGTIVALVLVIVVATLFVTTEYRRGLIRTSFAATPRRSQVLAAKALVAGTLAFAAGAIATAAAEVITRHVFAANGNYLFPQSTFALVRVITGTGLFLGLVAALAVALGAIMRRSVAAVATGFVLVIAPGILGSESGNWLMRLTPTAAFAIQATLPRSSFVTSLYTPPNGYFPISPWAGVGVLAAYTVAALGVAAWLLRRRDA